MNTSNSQKRSIVESFPGVTKQPEKKSEIPDTTDNHISKLGRSGFPHGAAQPMPASSDALSMSSQSFDSMPSTDSYDLVPLDLFVDELAPEGQKLHVVCDNALQHQFRKEEKSSRSPASARRIVTKDLKPVLPTRRGARHPRPWRLAESNDVHGPNHPERYPVGQGSNKAAASDADAAPKCPQRQQSIEK
jgi:hypothetical protein